MDDVLTYAIELAVGVATVLAGWIVGRGNGPRWLAALLVIAGVAACGHATAELIG